MSTELVVGIGSRENPDHMISPTKPQLQADFDFMITKRNKQKRQSHV